MTHGPKASPISSDVMAAITARKVMYWNTRKKPNSGDTVCSQLARLSSMRASAGREQRGHHLLHLHEARSLDDDRGGRRCHRERGDQGLHIVEMACAVKGGAGVRAERARGPQLVDAALLRIGAHLAMKLRT